MSNVLAWGFLKSVTFVFSSFLKIKTFFISLMLGMDVTIFHYVHSRLRAFTLIDIKIIAVKGVHYRVVSNKTYDECYCLLESNSSTDKFGSL